MRNRRRSHRWGIAAEYLALALLMSKGYRPLAMRYKTPVGEIDLVVRRRRMLAFVEVKGRRGAAAAAEAVHSKNQSRVMRAAQYFLVAHPHLADCQVRFDVCLVPWYSLPQHITQAFEATHR